jgi:hypothetical protein
MRQAIALVMGANLVACASAGGPPPQTGPIGDPAIMAGYIQRLPIGSRVKVERSTGSVLKGTLMHADASALVLQKTTETPEPPVTIPLADVTRVTVDTGSSTALKIWAGVGIALTTLYVLSAIFIAASQ